MSERIPERKETDPDYHWDLSSLYTNEQDWNKDFNQLDALTENCLSYKGRLQDSETIVAYFEAENKLSEVLDNLFTYASLKQSEDTRNSNLQSMYMRIYAKYTAIASQLSFAVPEILKLDDETLNVIKNSETIKDYAFEIQELIERKPHVLSGEEEKLLAGFSEVLNAPSEISEKLMDADLVFDSIKDENGTEIEVSGANYIALQMCEDRNIRKAAYQSLYKGYRQHINTFAASYNACVKKETVEAQFRHYESSRSMALAENHIPLSVYDRLIETVHERMGCMHRYANLRKKMLGVEELHYYDLYAPLVSKQDRKYTYEEARQLVLAALKPLGEEYRTVAEHAFTDHWIDVYPNKGKTGGAYSSGTYSSNPFILTNFTGNLDSVSTIAHELGHSMHTYYANHHQPYHLAGYTLFVAEVASTVNENLLIEQLLEKETDDLKRLSLLNQYMENFKGTVYRQTMFCEFEKIVHEKAEQGEALTAEVMNEIYKELIHTYFGDVLVEDEETMYEWARIPHFYRPFYVYVYATGYCSAVALSENIRKNPECAKAYLEFLSMGGSVYPLEELKHAGVDLTTADALNRALDKFEAVVEEAEALFEAENEK